MIKEEFNNINLIGEIGIKIIPGQLKNLDDRTLIYGYCIERKTFHLYLEGCEFKMVYYDYPNKLLQSYSKEILTTKDWILPNKRVYPECCDFEFCKILREYGLYPPFTTFNENHVKDKNDIYWGLRIEDCNKVKV